MPLPALDLKNKQQKVELDRLASLVGQMLQVQEQRAEAVTDAEGTYLDGRIRTLDHRIDALVYALYGLDEDDTKLIEETLDNESS